VDNGFFNWNKTLAKHGTKDIQVLHYGIWPWRRILSGTCISISNLPEFIAWQTHKDDLRPEARGLGRSPNLPPSNAAPVYVTCSSSHFDKQVTEFFEWTDRKSLACGLARSINWREPLNVVLCGCVKSLAKAYKLNRLWYQQRNGTHPAAKLNGITDGNMRAVWLWEFPTCAIQ
jgi:hypothetical protein